MRKLFGTGLLAMLITSFGLAEDAEFGALKSKIPEGWKSEKPKSAFRTLQYAVPKAEGDSEDGEMYVSFFGKDKGRGGDTEANLKRWKDQFIPPEGKKIDDIAKVTDFKIAGDKVKVHYLTVGDSTYQFKAQPFNPNGPITEKKGYRMLGAIIEADDGNYFVRLQGPAKTVEKQQKAFEDWVKGFK